MPLTAAVVSFDAGQSVIVITERSGNFSPN
jgi:hypothetical protein